MKAEDFPALVREIAIDGVEVRPADGKPGSGLQFGLIMTAPHGGRMAWQIAMQTDKKTGPAEGDPVPQQPPVPLTEGKLVSEEAVAALIAWFTRSPAATAIRKITPYDSRERKGIRYGFTLDLHNGERVFMQQLWALRPDEQPDGGNKYVSHEYV